MPSSPPVGPVTPGSEPNKIERPRPEDVKASTLAETILQQGFYSEKEIPLETQKEILKAHDTSLFYQMKVVLKVLGARISNTIGFIFSKSPITILFHITYFLFQFTQR